MNFNTEYISSIIEKNLIQHWMYLKNTEDSVHIDSKALQYISASPYNRVLYVKWEERESVFELAKGLNKNGENLKWIIGPSTNPTNLNEILERSGFNYLDTWTGMATSLSSLHNAFPKRDEFEFRKVNDEADLQKWIDVYVEGYQRPESDKEVLFKRFVPIMNHKVYQLYLGLYENKPAVVGTIFIDNNNIAGLYCITTAPVMRRKGLATIYLQNLLYIAYQQGASDCILHATDEGKPTYEKLGFESYNSFKVYQALT